MNSLSEHYQRIDGAFRNVKFLCVTIASACVAVTAVVLYFSFQFVTGARDVVYVVDEGSAVAARLTGNESTRAIEIEDHVVRFHELLFTLSPNEESIRRRADMAFEMADRSAYDFFSDQEEAGYYRRLVSANISQEMVVDSVRFSTASYPYKVLCYGKVDLTRESNVTRYLFVSSCRLRSVSRSSANPHGLLIEQFVMEKYENQGSRRRR